MEISRVPLTMLHTVYTTLTVAACITKENSFVWAILVQTKYLKFGKPKVTANLETGFRCPKDNFNRNKIKKLNQTDHPCQHNHS